MTKQPNNFRDWFKENLNDYALDIASHGADAGYPSITYTSDCVEIYQQFESEIWEMLCEDAEDMGLDSPVHLIAQFNRIDMTATPEQFKNLLVWYACERTAREYES